MAGMNRVTLRGRMAIVLALAIAAVPVSMEGATRQGQSRRPAVPAAASKASTRTVKAAASNRTPAGRKASTAAKSTPSARSGKSPSATPKSTAASSSASARRARLARARAAARAREARELQTPRFVTDASGQQVPDVRAEAAVIYNPETREVLWSSNADSERPIASITKVMTALVVLDSGIDPQTKVTVAASDVARASTTYLRRGYTVTVDDLLNLLLVGSDNAAARALARVSPYGAQGFVDRMNAKAQELGLAATHYADPSGLLAANVSNALDMAQLISYASADERIGGVMRKTSYTTQSGKRTITARSTNQLVKTGDIDVLGGKTGFISRSGYCLASLLRLPQTGQQVAVVVLGAKSNAGRFWETRHLFNWLSTKTSALLNAGATQPQPQPEP
ncbi:MAG: D-alanyl-D-alanine carboxypeptidase [Acidobacteria bacterium]|nr:D-alanyl-D-alanine carboxypeptidase [Acidobacteriota bacterium]